ncbi:TRAP transporter substrate-binding protein [Oceanibacterium hippocampi]|uniref:C4-dicarboxylate-binding periplasmic protein n=1 Tax=Oceanibacterium hippocampi TaxID=745714 RepID=A0A1Y5TTZ1_9PROT|nr:TRAP transporter substrate-binding protein [Oceanibacterium hippocampi]SLN70120.1 C4-dicarboxylate-binding periplasmic protein precursor [Oceanibacterium hippocampi]
MRNLWSLCIAAGLTLGLSTTALAEVKIAHDSPADPEGSGTYVWGHAFAEHLKANGMDAKEYERGSLGEEAERLDQVSQGLLEVSMSDVKSAGKVDKLIFGAYLPYLFDDIDHLDRAMNDAGLMAEINKRVKQGGIRVLALTALGPPSGIFNTKKPVETVADMADLRMRALDESQIALFKTWGTTGTIVSWAEVPNALQTGVADGYINPVFVPVMFGHTDFIKYFTDAKLTNAVRLAIASSDWYDGLSDKERGIVDAATVAATKANREWLAARESKMIEEVKAAGVAVTYLTPEARAEFVERSKQTYSDGVLSPEDAKLWIDASASTK